MPARWKTGLALLALFGCGPLRAAPPDAQAVISRCASQAGTEVTGISALGKACPGVQAALDQLGLTAFLPPSWPKTLTTHGLADLDALVQHYAQPPPSAAPRAATLRSIAARLTPPPLPPTWPQRIRMWIRHWAGSLLRPVVRWLRHLGPSHAHSGGAEAIFYGLIGLLLLAAAALLIVELRGAGLIGRRRPAARPRPRSRGGASFAEPLETESGEPDWALLREQPARVLRLLVDSLTRAHRLEGDHHLTCRELETQARFDTEIERGGFARVARLAERQIYGPPGAAALSEETLHDARMLHARLLAAAGKDGAIRP
jgi:hypothetical protein